MHQVLRKLTGKEWVIDALMHLQYNFNIKSVDPYEDVARRVDVKIGEFLSVLRKLKEEGILKRVGFYVNYRSMRLKAALIAIATKTPEEVTKYISSKLKVTHSYVRDHPIYNLWIVGKHKNEDFIVETVKRVAEAYGEGKWLILWGVRTYRLSVKYDLLKGVSRAGPYSRVNPNPPTPQELGYSIEFVRALRELPLEENPYKVLGREFGMTEDEVVTAVKELVEKGVLGDPGAALDGHKIGFKYNAMFAVAPKEGYSVREVCEWVENNIEEATHIVERSSTPPNAWPYLCYFMFHSVSENMKSLIVEKLSRCNLADSYLVIKSIRDLLPGIIR